MRTKMLSLVSLLGGVLFMSGPAWAGPCTDLDTVGEFVTATSCDSGDKTYTYLGTNLPGIVGLNITAAGLTNTLAMDFPDATGTGPQSYSFHFNITITDPNFVFQSVALDTTSAVDTTLVTKSEDGGKFISLVSLNGVPTADSSIPGGQTTLNVLDQIEINAGGQLVSLANTFTQLNTSVPEPSTFILMGIGLASLGVLRRRKLR